MIRTKRAKEVDLNPPIDSDQFIERKIMTGLITNTDYTKKVLSIKNENPVRLLGSSTAKRLATWCIEYYKEYQEAPRKQIENIFIEKTKNDKADSVEDIKDIIAGLSDEYEERGNEINAQYLFDQTFKYFQNQQGKLHKEKLSQALENEDIDEFTQTHTLFKPIQIESDQETTFKGMEIYNVKINPVQWLISDMLPKGLTIFGGQSKIGKSFLALYITMHLAQNKMLFADQSHSAYRGPEGPVLYLALEDTTERLKNRIKSIEPDPNQELLNRYLTLDGSWEKLDRGGLTDIEDWLKNAKEPKLVVIDVIAKVWDMKRGTGGGRMYAEEYGIYSPLADLAHKYDTSIVAITHTKKTKEADVFNQILGGAGTQGPADNLMVLSRHPSNSKKRLLSIRGKDTEERHLLFSVHNNGADWQCEGEADEVQKTNQRQAVVDYLKEMGSLPLKDIQKAARDGKIDISPKSANTILRKMVSDGTLEQSSRYGSYCLPGRTNSLIKISKQQKMIE